MSAWGSRLLFSALATVSVVTSAKAQASRIQDLAFGTVVTGTTTSTSVAGPSAAQWRIHVSLLSALGSFTLTLPATLTRSGGGATMPVSFCATCGRYRINNSNVSGATTFNPSSTVTFSLLGVGSDVYVWLGGSVSPPLNQTPGSYTGTIVLTTSGLIL
jgi:hypothetical protein